MIVTANPIYRIRYSLRTLLPQLFRVSIFRMAFVAVVAGSGLFSVRPIHAEGRQFDWSGWDRILHSYVATGTNQGITSNLVNYQALSTNRDFYKIARALQQYNPASLSGNEKKAFYINAYNYFAVYLVVSHWPVNSIRDIGNLFWPVWYRDAGKINGQNISLNEIENDILRPMHDPRIHFAIVCASMSCPNLRKEAYDSQRLNEQLADQITELMASQDKGVRISDGQVKISSLFEWYEGDFDDQGGVIGFLRQYSQIPPEITRVEYLPYNWHVNAQTHSRPTH